MIEIVPQAQPHPKYHKVNGCTNRPSCPQIVGVLLIATVITLHANIVTEVNTLNDIILTILLIFYFVLLGVIIVYYFQLLLSDPVDPRLLSADYKEK